MSKTKQKKQRRQRSRNARSTSRSLPRALHDALMEADRLDREQRWNEARELLEQLDRRYPRRVEVLTLLVNVCYEIGDITSYQFACQRLLLLKPDDPDLRLMLAGSCLTNLRPAMALRSFRQFLQRWPDDPRADEVRRTATDLEAKLAEFLRNCGFSGEDGLQLAALHEEVLCCLQQGEDRQARQLIEKLLSKAPEFLSPLNNLAEVHFREGRTDDAIAVARRVLQREPENFHALGNLTRYLYLSGRTEEARASAERLKSVESTHSDFWAKKAETFSYLGDHQAVLDAFDAARKQPDLQIAPSDEGLLYHLAAVASMRLGRERDARKHWKRALKLNPRFSTIADNLHDLDRPVGQRHATWAYGIENWLSESVVRKLSSRLDRVQRRGNEKDASRETRRFLKDHPQVAAVLPMLLDRGGPAGREFAFRVAMLAKTPEALEALREFALSRQGPDRLREQAAQKVCEAGLLPSGPVRMWIQGEWQDILLFGFEVHGEPTRVHQPHVDDLACDAIDALKSDGPQEAERLLKQALEFEPDALDLLNNLATAYRHQGRIDEWRRIVQQVHRRDPDYLFGRVNMALHYLDQRDLAKAREMLQPLLSRRRFHHTEFAALCQGQIELSRTEGNVDVARSWLRIWEDICPGHPELEFWERRIASSGPLRNLFRMLNAYT